MKKMLAILFSVMMAFSLAACSNGAPSSGADSSPATPTPSPEPASASSEPLESAETPAPADSAAEVEQTEAGGTLVAYFSWSGNTQQMAEIIAQETGADLFEIATVTCLFQQFFPQKTSTKASSIENLMSICNHRSTQLTCINDT